MEPQVIKLLLAELEHEIGWKAVNVPFDRPYQKLGLHSVKVCQVGIKHNFLFSD
jgi:hypothetical protein